MANSLSISIRVDGAKEVLAAFRKLPKEASDALRQRSQELATALAGRVSAAAVADSAQSALMAGTVRARRDRIPVIEAGGTKRVGRHRNPAYKILFGSEFGSNQWHQFRPHVGKGSYWMFRTVEVEQTRIAQAWSKAADDVIRSFGSAV